MRSYGGEFFVLSEVEEGSRRKTGRPKGYELKNGTEIAADIVISDLSVELTLRGRWAKSMYPRRYGPKRRS